MLRRIRLTLLLIVVVAICAGCRLSGPREERVRVIGVLLDTTASYDTARAEANSVLQELTSRLERGDTIIWHAVYPAAPGRLGQRPQTGHATIDPNAFMFERTTRDICRMLQELNHTEPGSGSSCTAGLAYLAELVRTARAPRGKKIVLRTILILSDLVDDPPAVAAEPPPNLYGIDRVCVAAFDASYLRGPNLAERRKGLQKCLAGWGARDEGVIVGAGPLPQPGDLDALLVTDSRE